MFDSPAAPSGNPQVHTSLNLQENDDLQVRTSSHLTADVGLNTGVLPDICRHRQDFTVRRPCYDFTRITGDVCGPTHQRQVGKVKDSFNQQVVDEQGLGRNRLPTSAGSLPTGYEKYRGTTSRESVSRREQIRAAREGLSVLFGTSNQFAGSTRVSPLGGRQQQPLGLCGVPHVSEIQPAETHTGRTPGREPAPQGLTGVTPEVPTRRSKTAGSPDFSVYGLGNPDSHRARHIRKAPLAKSLAFGLNRRGQPSTFENRDGGLNSSDGGAPCR